MIAGVGLETKPTCENRHRSTLKCRKKCCRKPAPNPVRKSGFQATLLSTTPCVMCGKTIYDGLAARIVCSDRCETEYWRFLNRGD